MTRPYRLSSTGRIDRNRAISFALDGKAFRGSKGDTLASALLANGVRLIGRSFKYHRPRGIMSAGIEEPNALVTLGSGDRREPNIAATVTELVDGLVAETQNRWPSLGFDVMEANRIAGPLFAAGFYYKTFIGPSRGSWVFFEPFLCLPAGLRRGRLS